MRRKQQLYRLLGHAVLLVAACSGGTVLAQDVSKPPDTPSGERAVAAAPAPVQLSQEEMKKLFVKKVQPVYPPLAQQARVTGKVLLRLTVRTDGIPRDIALISGHPMLAPAAIEAAKKSKFRAFLVDGKPVEAQGKVEYEFF